MTTTHVEESVRRTRESWETSLELFELREGYRIEFAESDWDGTGAPTKEALLGLDEEAAMVLSFGAHLVRDERERCERLALRRTHRGEMVFLYGMVVLAVVAAGGSIAAEGLASLANLAVSGAAVGWLGCRARNGGYERLIAEAQSKAWDRRRTKLVELARAKWSDR